MVMVNSQLDFPDHKFINLEKSENLLQEYDVISDKILNEIETYSEKKLRELINFYHSKFIQIHELGIDEPLDQNDDSVDGTITKMNLFKLEYGISVLLVMLYRKLDEIMLEMIAKMNEERTRMR